MNTAKIKCNGCGSFFIPTEMDHLPFFMCNCGFMNENPTFNKFGYHSKFEGRQDWWTHSRNTSL